MRVKVLFFIIFTVFLEAKDYRISKPLAWRGLTLNYSAISLYGKNKFSTIQKSNKIELIVPKITISDKENISIKITSTLKAKSLAIFKDKSPYHLIAIFDLNDKSIIDYELNIRLDIKNTIFSVIEGVDGQLYYKRAFIDILCLACVSGDKND